MTVLLDHNIPHVLRSHFPGECEVYTAQYLGWENYADDRLLKVAVEHDFSVLVTLDTNLKHQQSLDQWAIGVIVFDVHPATPPHFIHKMDEVRSVLLDVAENETLFECS
jgi:hypothetical protein